MNLHEDDFPERITLGDKYGPAMSITSPEEAEAYFEKCVRHTMRFGNDRATAESIERSNLGYFAGYYNSETRRRVESLFSCTHPIFGSIEQNGPPTPEDAFQAGVKLAGKE